MPALTSTGDCYCEHTCSTLDALAARCSCGSCTRNSIPHCAAEGLKSCIKQMRDANAIEGMKLLLSWLVQARDFWQRNTATHWNPTLSSGCSCMHKHRQRHTTDQSTQDCPGPTVHGKSAHAL